ncbi:MAG: hypothetical protein LC739_13475 [Actinobacteria bacterium]|nr:hypothetical protein [Actinomycetota bacterium]
MRPAVTMPGYHQGREPANKGRKYPAEILTPEEIAGLFQQISAKTSLGLRKRALITVLYRAGLRHFEALALLPKMSICAPAPSPSFMARVTAAASLGSIPVPVG